MAQQCAALDQQGARCSKRGVVQADYHGDPEIYSPLKLDSVQSVQVWFCLIHGQHELWRRSKAKKD